MIELRQYIEHVGAAILSTDGSEAQITPPRHESPSPDTDSNAVTFVQQLKGVGTGVFELRLDFGPGYRIYFGKDGETLVILLGGGTKKRQQIDIEVAQTLWQEYKKRKREE